MTIVTIIQRHLRQRLARTFALIFSVALVAALTTVFVAGRTFFRTADVLLDRPLIIVFPLYPYNAWLRDADTPKIRALPHFVSLSRGQTHDMANAEGSYSFATFGADETYFTVANKDGIWFPTTAEMVDRFRKDRLGFIVGELTAEKMGYQVGRQYVLKTEDGEITGNCVGISRGGANKRNLVLHYDYVDAVLGNSEGRITDWIVEVSHRDHVDSTITAINEMFKTTATPTTAVPVGDHVRAQSSQQQSIVNLLGIVCLLIFFVTMFITLNTVLFLMRERRQVLAAMRAIGFRSRHVFVLVVAEVMALCLLGGAIGVGLVLFLFRNGIPFAGGNMLVSIHPEAAAAGVGVTVLISLVASVIPSWLASRVDILNALRST